MPPELTPEVLLQVIGREFVDNAPKGWATGELLFMRVGKTAWLRGSAFDTSGNVIGGPGTRVMIKAFDDLRRLLAQPGKGAFLTARFTLRASDGHMRVDYDYDHEPVFDAPIHPGHYVEELERNPREPERIPEWWLEKIEQSKRSGDA